MHDSPPPKKKRRVDAYVVKGEGVRTSLFPEGSKHVFDRRAYAYGITIPHVRHE